MRPRPETKRRRRSRLRCAARCRPPDRPTNGGGVDEPPEPPGRRRRRRRRRRRLQRRYEGVTTTRPTTEAGLAAAQQRWGLKCAELVVVVGTITCRARCAHPRRCSYAEHSIASPDRVPARPRFRIYDDGGAGLVGVGMDGAGWGGETRKAQVTGGRQLRGPLSSKRTRTLASRPGLGRLLAKFSFFFILSPFLSPPCRGLPKVRTDDWVRYVDNTILYEYRAMPNFPSSRPRAG